MAEGGSEMAIDRAVPRATVRALRAIADHPGVRRIEAEHDATGGHSIATVSIDTDLPSRWRARGHADNGILAVEPVTFVFGPGFPLVAPEIRFREDFDGSHPHLLPREPGAAPEPCLVLGSAAELIRARGFPGLVDQLVDWLRKAALVQLIDPTIGWEPTRRDHVRDHVVADLEPLSALPERDPGSAVFETRFVGTADGSAFVVHLSDRRAALSPAGLNLRYARRPGRDGEPGCYFGNGHALVAWPGRSMIAGRYAPETVTDLASLYDRAALFGCADGLARLLKLVSNRLAGTKFAVTTPLLVILLARRPCNLIGTISPIEICPYVVSLHGCDDLSRRGKATVAPASLQERIGIGLLRRASGDHPGDARLPWTLLGCGSVGSKIALHMARTGRGPSTIVDRAFMRPHNHARHALVPPPGDAGLGFGLKTELLAESLAELRQEPSVGSFDIVGGLLTEGAEKVTGPKDAFAVVNATAAASVREALCLPEVIRERARVVESCLFGAGRVGFMSVEGPGANPSTNDLATEAYRLFAVDEDMRGPVFGAEAEAIDIGQGCSSVTFPMPDATLSALTAPMAGELARLHAAGLPPEGGELLLGLAAEDGLGQVWRRHPVAPWIAVEAGAPGAPGVRISPRVDRIIRDAVAARPGKETGGVLIGRFSDVSETFHVVDCLPAPPDSRFSASEFVLGTDGLAGAIDRIVTESGGSLHPLGTWHNHLVTSGPSVTDVRTALQLAAAQILPVLLLIHTPSGYRHLTAEATIGTCAWTDPSGGSKEAS
ncbi:Mov34/MPN/PAD-1 family protein [Bosea sp. TAF32]|uniref:Mov34/MPN/PAD-1 family protein n=1 Tax=Bosea sp. TAF32 TaxID=3237482 RepID=UPI003F8DC199